MDNQVAYAYLHKKGGRLLPFNAILRPFLLWCHKNNVKVVPNWVKSEEMLADGISRWKNDRGDYTLKRSVFLNLLGIFGKKTFSPEVDFFASPGNSQLKNFVSRWPHHQAIAVNALECDLKNFSTAYANPPWTLILQWLLRLKANPHLQVLTVVPFWVGTTWWPLLTRLRVTDHPVVKVNPAWGLFRNCLGEDMPPTRWPLLCVMLSGKAFKENKFRLKISKII